MGSTERITTNDLLKQLKNARCSMSKEELIELCYQAAENIESQVRAIHTCRIHLGSEYRVADSAIAMLSGFVALCGNPAATAVQIEYARQEALQQIERWGRQRKNSEAENGA